MGVTSYALARVQVRLVSWSATVMPLGGGLEGFAAKFQKENIAHKDTQSNNPFSESYAVGTRPKFTKEEYGRPKTGSKTEERGLKAKSHIYKEILELCSVIYDLAMFNKEMSRKREEKNEEVEAIVVSFGELFETYNHISNKVVGLLIQAKKRGLVDFEKEMLFQGRDNGVSIKLLKTITEINLMTKENL